MPDSLALARAQQDVAVLARGGLDLERFLAEALESVGRALPSVAACIATHDPRNHLLTSARKYGDLDGRNQADHEFGIVEYGGVEPTSFTELARREYPVGGVHHSTGGDIARSFRLNDFMRPHFGYTDEARVLFSDNGVAWGALAVFRGPDDRPFDEEDLAALATFSPAFARGVRAGLLTNAAATGAVADPVGLGPAVVMVDRDNRITQITPSAEQYLAALAAGPGHCDPISPVTAIIGAARRYARGEITTPPHSRLRTASGQWLSVYAGPITQESAVGTAAGSIVVTMEEARPPEIVELVISAFSLTSREREVTAAVLRGASTKEIAAELFLSPYTVQDHLKSVFEKAQVGSRRELMAKVYFDQYEPRLGSALSPDGWFAG